MAAWEPVGSIRRRSNSGSGDKDRPKFISCVNILQPQIHEVWTFGEESVTHKVHLTARVDVGTGFTGEFATDSLTPIWHRVPMFGRNYINEISKWLGVPDFLINDGPPWTLNLLDSYSNWGDRGSITNPNWGSGYGGITEVFLSRGIVLPISFQFITRGYLKTCAVMRAVPVTISLRRTAHTICKVIPLVVTPSTVVLVYWQGDGWDDFWDFLVGQ